MFTADNCPYIVVGVPAFADKSEAAVGFARASKRLKAMANSPFSLDALTAALSRIESKGVGNQLTYAIPADFELFTRPTPPNSLGVDGSDASQLLEKANGQFADIDREAMSLLLLRSGLQQLLEWNWSRAEEMLKTCLKLSNNEQIRDEALNLIAAVLVMNGDNERAMQALSKAVEGDWNLRLQANLAMLALESNPKLAIEQMSFLVDGAIGTEEKLSAIKMAIGLWRQVQHDEIGTDDEEDFEPIPEKLTRSIIETLEMKDITEEDFFDLGLFLARVSPGSVTKPALARTRWSGRASAEIIFARSAEFNFYIENVVRLAYLDRNRPDCVNAHIDGLVEEVVQGLFDDKVHLTAIAFSFLEQGLGVENMHRIWLRGALVRALPKVLDDDSGPSEKFVLWIQQAKENVKYLTIPDELRSLTNELIDGSCDLLMRLELRDFFKLASNVESAANRINQQMTGFWNRLGADKNSIREISSTGIQWCNDQLAMFDKYLKLGLTDPELRKQVAELRDATNQIKQIFLRNS